MSTTSTHLRPGSQIRPGIFVESSIAASLASLKTAVQDGSTSLDSIAIQFSNLVKDIYVAIGIMSRADLDS